MDGSESAPIESRNRNGTNASALGYAYTRSRPSGSTSGDDLGAAAEYAGYSKKGLRDILRRVGLADTPT